MLHCQHQLPALKVKVFQLINMMTLYRVQCNFYFYIIGVGVTNGASTGQPPSSLPLSSQLQMNPQHVSGVF